MGIDLRKVSDLQSDINIVALGYARGMIIGTHAPRRSTPLISQIDLYDVS